MGRRLVICLLALLGVAPLAAAANPAAQLVNSDVYVQPGSKAPRGAAAALASKARTLRARGVPTKFAMLRVLPTRPIAYSAALRTQLRRRIGEDPNVVIYWPRSSYVAFDARVPDAEESDAFDAIRRMRSPVKMMTTLADRLAAEDAVSGGTQPARGPLTVGGPQGPITATPCVGGALLDDPDKCGRTTSDLVFPTSPLDLVLEVRIAASCQPGAGSYQVAVVAPPGFDDSFNLVSPVVCGSTAVSEERVFEFHASLGPARRGVNAAWDLVVNGVSAGQSALQIRRFHYLPASSRLITERSRDDFFNICLDGDHNVRSSGGTLYCFDFLESSGEVRVSTG